jgi:CheY-like chemotaxis protein
LAVRGVVDDDETVRKSISYLLTAKAYPARTATHRAKVFDKLGVSNPTELDHLMRVAEIAATDDPARQKQNG